MKKILVLLAIMLPLCAAAEDVVSLDGLNEPEWKSFVPPAYVDVDEPKGLGKLNETDSDAKLGCYQQLKVKQYQLNSDYNARIEAQEKARMGPQEMFDKTDTMLPIGGYLNNFTRFQPNEFR